MVVGTDGLWDNLFDSEIAAALAAPLNSPSTLARALGEAAYLRSKERRARTPFALHALQHGLNYPGGKPDDISLIVLSYGGEEGGRARL